MIEYFLGGVVAAITGYAFANIYGVAFLVLLYYIGLCLFKLNNIEKKLDKIINISDISNNEQK